LCRMGLLADGMLPWQSRRRVVRPQVSPRSPAPRLRPPGRHTHPVADPAGKPRQCRTVHTDNAAGRRTVRRAAALTGALMLVSLVGCWSPDAGRPRRAAPGLTRLLRPWSVRPIGRPTITQARSGVAPQMSPSAVVWACRAGRGGVRPTPGDREPGDRGHGERLRVCPVRPRWAQVVSSVSLGQPMPGADGWTGRPRIPRGEVPARSLIIGATPGQNPSASTGAWPHGVQRLGYCSRSLPC